VLVTGAAGGIGRAVCRRLAQGGADVLAADRTEDALAGVPGRPVAFDVTDDAAVRRAVSEVGPLDGLVLCHGITALGPAADVPAAAVDRVLDVNLRGAILVTLAALPGLVQQRGRIAVLTSVAGFAPLVHRTAYAASKHGVHGFFDSLRAELAPAGVSVTLVAPSFTATGIEERAAYRSAGRLGTWSTTGEVLSPEQVAAAVVGGMAARRRLVLPSRTARLAYAVSRIAPARYEATMRRRVLG
ncbi:MAG: SDR family NAD(P)-dependent oxidoreductase, partial [Actinomycetia bacterium]|nr:SDR family NAD(P)-dependent oxidoreductase [Actinomycetes bacterium]